MSDEYRTPDTYATGQKEPGFEAVRSRYGDDMVTRFKLWPKLEEVYQEAQGMTPDDRSYQDAIESAGRKRERAARDKDYALAQAEMIVRASIPRHEWAALPTVDQLRREWWPEPDPARERSRAWATENPEWGQGRSKT